MLSVSIHHSAGGEASAAERAHPPRDERNHVAASASVLAA